MIKMVKKKVVKAEEDSIEIYIPEEAWEEEDIRLSDKIEVGVSEYECKECGRLLSDEDNPFCQDCDVERYEENEKIVEED